VQPLQGNLHVGTGRPDGGVSRAASGEGGEPDAEAFFRADAEKLGYLTDPRGMARYYRDHGMLPPRYLEEGHVVEVTGLELDRLECRS
jgi:hypothetical protein